MTSTQLRKSPDELGRIGLEKLTLNIEPQLIPDDDGKFVAIDVNSDAFELDEDDLTAVSRLLARQPDADIWLGRVGQTTTCRIGRTQ